MAHQRSCRHLPVLLTLTLLASPTFALQTTENAPPTAAPAGPENGRGVLNPSSEVPHLAVPLPSLGASPPGKKNRAPLADRRELLLYLGGIGLLTATDQDTRRWFDSDRFESGAERNSSRDNASDLASGWPILVEMALPALVDGRYGRQSAKMAAGAALSALVLVQPLKLLVGKERPDQARGSLVFHGPSTGHYSFPSGHAAIAFAVATVYVKRYPRWKIPIYLLATGVGLSRVSDGRHYLSDVFAGAGIGVLAGRASLRANGRLLAWRF